MQLLSNEIKHSRPNNIVLNGAVLTSDTAILALENRAFRYSDGLFETIRMFDGKAVFIALHMARLWHGMTILGYIVPPHFEQELLQNIQQLTANQGNHRIRIQVWRKAGGLYRSNNHHIEWLIETSPLPHPIFTLPQAALHVGIDPHIHPLSGDLAGLKTVAALPYILAANRAQNLGLDDVLLTNTDGSIAEGTRGNIFFLLHDNRITTPPDDSCGIHGTMRDLVLTFLKKNDYTIAPKITSEEIISLTKYAFLTNAIAGILPSCRINDTILQPNTLGEQLTTWLNECVSAYH